MSKIKHFPLFVKSVWRGLFPKTEKGGVEEAKPNESEDETKNFQGLDKVKFYLKNPGAIMKLVWFYIWHPKKFWDNYPKISASLLLLTATLIVVTGFQALFKEAKETVSKVPNVDLEQMTPAMTGLQLWTTVGLVTVVILSAVLFVLVSNRKKKEAKSVEEKAVVTTSPAPEAKKEEKTKTPPSRAGYFWTAVVVGSLVAVVAYTLGSTPPEQITKEALVEVTKTELSYTPLHLLFILGAVLVGVTVWFFGGSKSGAVIVAILCIFALIAHSYGFFAFEMPFDATGMMVFYLIFGVLALYCLLMGEPDKMAFFLMLLFFGPLLLCKLFQVLPTLKMV